MPGCRSQPRHFLALGALGRSVHFPVHSAFPYICKMGMIPGLFIGGLNELACICKALRTEVWHLGRVMKVFNRGPLCLFLYNGGHTWVPSPLSSHASFP